MLSKLLKENCWVNWGSTLTLYFDRVTKCRKNPGSVGISFENLSHVVDTSILVGTQNINNAAWDKFPNIPGFVLRAALTVPGGSAQPFLFPNPSLQKLG